MSRGLLDDVLAAHGGRDRWALARRVRARVRSGGLLPRTRMPGNRFADYRLTVSIEGRRTVMDPFPGDSERGVFDEGEARIENADGEVLESREHPREAFSGLSGLRRNLRWDALDSTYFAGYAMWNYLSFPFLLCRDGIKVSEGEPWKERGEQWRRLEATFPTGIDTHSERQVFYVGPDGLLRRHDYVAEPVGGWARAAHYTADPVEVGGLVFATRRWVRPIAPGNRALPFPTLVSLELSEIEVE